MGQPPGHRFCHVAVVHNESMYVFGGYDGSNRLNDFVEFHFEQVHKRQRQFRYYACLRQALAQAEKWFDKDPEYARKHFVTVYPVQTTPQAAFALSSKGKYQKQINKKSFRDNNADDIYYATELVAGFEELQIKKAQGKKRQAEASRQGRTSQKKGRGHEVPIAVEDRLECDLDTLARADRQQKTQEAWGWDEGQY